MEVYNTGFLLQYNVRLKDAAAFAQKQTEHPNQWMHGCKFMKGTVTDASTGGLLYD
jgi:hypothetical protein